MIFALRICISILMLAIAKLPTPGDAQLAHYNPAVSEYLEIWNKWLPKRGTDNPEEFPKSFNENDACTVTKRQNEAISAMLTYFSSRDFGEGITFYGHIPDHINERFLGQNFAYFLKVTEPIQLPFHETYCADDRTVNMTKKFAKGYLGNFQIQTDFTPPPLVCNDNLCVRCNNSDVSDSLACRLRQDHDEVLLTGQDLSKMSHKILPDAKTMIQMSAEEFSHEQTYSHDFSEDHYFVSIIMDKWKKWMEIKGSDKTCGLSEDDQVGLAAIDHLMSSTSNPRQKLAKNFMWYLLQTDSLNDTNIRTRCVKGLVCKEGKCEDSASIRLDSPSNDPWAPKEYPPKLYIASYLMGKKDPMDPSNPDSKVTTTPKTTSNSGNNTDKTTYFCFITVSLLFQTCFSL